MNTAIGPVEPGGAPPSPSPATITAAQSAAQALYGSLGTEKCAPQPWESSGVVVSGANLWLAVAAVTGNSCEGTSASTLPVSLYLWMNAGWTIQGTVPVPSYPGLNGGVGADSVSTVSLTGSGNPDFMVEENGADWAPASVISDAGGTWHAVPFDIGSGGTFSQFTTVTGNVIWGDEDLCGCAPAEPQDYNWFQYSNGEFRPTEPLGALPPCNAQQLTNLVDTSTTTSTNPNFSPITVPGKVTFDGIACDDGWALAKGTADGRSVVDLFNWQTWQTPQWVSENIGSPPDIANDSFGIPPDLLKRLAREIGVTIPPAAKQ